MLDKTSPPGPPLLLRELAHELRDALSPARSALDLMRLRGFAAEVSGAMAPRIEQGLERALATLEAFVLAEQCESGTAALSPVPVRLPHLLELALETLPAPQRARCRVQPPVPIIVLADPERSVQVLTAMLQWALTGVPEKAPVEVCAASCAHGAQLRVAFAEAQLPVSEQWFGSYRTPAGAGALALRTARGLMRLQRGSLELRVQGDGRGELVAGFALASPVETPGTETHTARAGSAGDATADTEPAASESAANDAAPAEAGRRAGDTRLLMVEDNADVRRSYREALTAMGYEVIEARNAEEALEAAAAALPAVALIDIHLPGMNGYRLAQALRSRATGAIRLVMLSGVTLDEITQRLSREAGFDQCFDKAAGPRALHALLLRLL